MYTFFRHSWVQGFYIVNLVSLTLPSLSPVSLYIVLCSLFNCPRVPDTHHTVNRNEEPLMQQSHQLTTVGLIVLTWLVRKGEKMLMPSLRLVIFIKTLGARRVWSQFSAEVPVLFKKEAGCPMSKGHQYPLLSHRVTMMQELTHLYCFSELSRARVNTTSEEDSH